MDFLLRFGAACGVLCGAFIAVPGAIEAFTGETAPTSFALGLSPALAAPLLTAIHLVQRHAAGRFGATAYAVNLIGLAWFGGAAYALNLALFYLDDAVVEDLLDGPTRVALLGSAAVFVAGTVLFAIAMVRARVLPRVPAWAYGVALPVFALLAPLPDSPLSSGLHVLVGCTLGWLSVALRSRDGLTEDGDAGVITVDGHAEVEQQGVELEAHLAGRTPADPAHQDAEQRIPVEQRRGRPDAPGGQRAGDGVQSPYNFVERAADVTPARLRRGWPRGR